MFISFDGIDGVGKSTQIELCCQWLTEQNREVVRCRDPGSTELGEALRYILLSGEIEPIGRRAEMLIYMAARAQMVEEIIQPALAAGKDVVSDRFLLSNVVYQGYGGGLDVDELWEVGRIACAGVEPDLSIVLDMDPEAALERLARDLDRMEQQGLEFRRRIREGFLAAAAQRPESVVVISADESIDAVQAEIRTALQKVMGPG